MCTDVAAESISNGRVTYASQFEGMKRSYRSGSAVKSGDANQWFQERKKRVAELAPELERPWERRCCEGQSTRDAEAHDSAQSLHKAARHERERGDGGDGEWRIG